MVHNPSIAIIGLGYVGLPLAVEFGKQFPTIGFDIKAERIDELRSGCDSTLEVEARELSSATHLSFSDQTNDLDQANVYIVTVPTPIDDNKRPDLRAVAAACTTAGTQLTAGDLVIFESTVYPGVTEEFCVPRLEQASGLVYNEDFYVGYSPERINPGDRSHRLPNIVKVTAGSTPEAADRVDALYSAIISAGTHKAPSIKVAEAAKVIENTQRDVNIALMNELAMIFNRLDIETGDVLEAASSKWNFLPFQPGLVGGHCIGVDPYYLTHKAQAIGYHPEMILAGRRINDNMGEYVAAQFVKALLQRQIAVKGARVLVMGLTFKENCPDLRNTKVVDVIRELEDYNVQLDVHDPWVDAEEARAEYGLEPVTTLQPGVYDGIIIAVAHRQFQAMDADAIRALGRTDHVLYDLKHVLPTTASDLRL